jgi:plasmid maintenance system antidote protein VapI
MPVEGARSDDAAGKCEVEQGHNTGVKPVAVAMDTAIAALLIILGVKKTKKGRGSEKKTASRGESNLRDPACCRSLAVRARTPHCKVPEDKMWGGSGRFEDPEEAKRAVEELVKERETLLSNAASLEKLIDTQKQVLEELETQVDAAQRRAIKTVDDAKVKMEEVHSKDAELKMLKERLNSVIAVFGMERDFRKLSHSVGQLRETLFPYPLVIAGPAAVGKASLISMLFQEFPHSFSIPISHTSRQRMPDEQNGVHYIFVSRQEMEQAMAQGLFVEVAEVDKDLYGTCIQAVTKEQNAGKVCVLHIDLAGVEQLRQSSMQPVCVWLEPPSLEALRQRYSVYLH